MTAANRPSAVPSPASGAVRRARSVLLVDHDRPQRDLIARQLRRAGYRVSVAADGDAALAACDVDEPDLILSDWTMPDMSGLELCRAFRRRDRSGHGYFILLTSDADEADIARGLEAGADDFLTKPVAGQELLARLLSENEFHGL